MHKIILKVGEVYHQPMDQLGTAGYSWEYSIKKGNDIIQITQLGMTVPPVIGTKSTIPNTYEGKLEFVIKGIKFGSAIVLFFLHRTWEKNKPPLKEMLLSVEVRK